MCVCVCVHVSNCRGLGGRWESRGRGCGAAGVSSECVERGLEVTCLEVVLATAHSVWRLY